MSEVIAWIDADGTEHLLSDQAQTQVLRGMQGRFMPPVAAVREDTPQRAGTRIREMRVLASEIDVPVLIKATSADALRTKVRTVLYDFWPVRGDGTLKMTANDGSIRKLAARYVGGLEGREDLESSGLHYQKLVLTFLANGEPYWEADTATEETYSSGSATTFFPFFPLKLTSSTVFALPTITNPGDVEAWPVWTITGPGSDLVLRNTTTDKSLGITTTLGPGEQVVIDTRPDVKTVEDQSGTNLMSALSRPFSLWPLQKGANEVRIEMNSATVDSRVQLSYTPRYLGV